MFITLFVYKNGGNKVYYPNEIKPIQDGVKTNSAHYLVKLVTDDNDLNGPTFYTLVVNELDWAVRSRLSPLQVSQYEKNVDIFYSLRVYSTCEFALNPVPEYYNTRYQQEITGEWKGKTAGGCQNNQATYKNNPLFQLVLNNRDANNHGMSKDELEERRLNKRFSASENWTTCTEAISSGLWSGLYRDESEQRSRRVSKNGNGCLSIGILCSDIG